jgi:hypothetical protein
MSNLPLKTSFQTTNNDDIYQHKISHDCKKSLIFAEKTHGHSSLRFNAFKCLFPNFATKDGRTNFGDTFFFIEGLFPFGSMPLLFAPSHREF